MTVFDQTVLVDMRNGVSLEIFSKDGSLSFTNRYAMSITKLEMPVLAPTSPEEFASLISSLTDSQLFL
jgi:hypothetical protein